METIRRAISNGLILMLSHLVNWTTTLILTSYLARYLGAAGFGELYLAMSFAAIFLVLVEFGLNQQLVRAVARNPSATSEAASEYLTNSVVIKCILFAVLYALILVLAASLHYPAQTVS